MFSWGSLTHIDIVDLIIFKNPRDQLQFEVLARQMNPTKIKFLKEAYNDATENPFGYLFLDLKQSTETRNRIQTGILPHQKRIIYIIGYILRFMYRLFF